LLSVLVGVELLPFESSVFLLQDVMKIITLRNKIEISLIVKLLFIKVFLSKLPIENKYLKKLD
jgi:hypothetical protein